MRIENLTKEIMEYIKKNANDVMPDMYCGSSEIYSVFGGVDYGERTKPEVKKARREVSKVLQALRTLGLVELEYVPESDYRGIPWLKVPAYRLTERGLKFLELIDRMPTHVGNESERP